MDKRISDLSDDRLKLFGQKIEAKRKKQFNDRIDKILNENLSVTAKKIKEAKQHQKDI